MPPSCDSNATTNLLTSWSTQFNVLRHIKLCGVGMTYDEFSDELERSGLTIRAFADLVGMKPNSVSNYAGKEEVSPHLARIAILIAELGSRGMDFRTPLSRVPCSIKKARGRAQAGQFAGDRQSRMDLS